MFTCTYLHFFLFSSQCHFLNSFFFTCSYICSIFLYYSIFLTWKLKSNLIFRKFRLVWGNRGKHWRNVMYIQFYSVPISMLLMVTYFQFCAKTWNKVIILPISYTIKRKLEAAKNSRLVNHQIYVNYFGFQNLVNR